MSRYIEERIWAMWGCGKRPIDIALRLNLDLVYDDGKSHWNAEIVEKTLIWMLWRTGKLDTVDIHNQLAGSSKRGVLSEAEIERQIHRPQEHLARLAAAQEALDRTENRLGVRH